MNNDPLTAMLEQLPGVMLREGLTLLWTLLTSWQGACLLLLLAVKWLHDLYQGFLRQVERLDRPRGGRRHW